MLVITAVIVAAFGGFRLRLGSVRFALTSPYRLLLWAAVAAVVRHFTAPGAPIYRDLPSRLRVWWSAEPVRSARVVFVGTRPAILLAGYLAVFMIGYPRAEPPIRWFENEFLNLQMRWDTGWYVGIALNGYQYDAARPDIQQNIVFFPAMPLLMRVAGRLLGGAPPTMFIGGTIVAWVAFLGALMYLFRFARDLLGDEDRAATAVWLVATYPFAVWFGATYTESLYLLGAVASLYHFKNGDVWKGGAWGLLVGLTRPNGCFLSLPLAILALRPWLPGWLAGGPVRPSDDSSPGGRRMIAAIAAASLPVIGVLIYSAYIWYLTGDPLSWAEGHVAWGRSYQGLTILVEERYKFLSNAGLYAYTSQAADDVLQVAGVLFALLPVWAVARRFGLAYAVFILINILPPLAAGGVLSAGRFSSVLFPAFIWVAGAIKERHRPAWYGTFMAVQALNAIMFYTWRPMF